MSKLTSNAMLLLSGYLTIVSLVTAGIGFLVVSGVSTTQRPSAFTVLSTPKQSVVK